MGIDCDLLDVVSPLGLLKVEPGTEITLIGHWSWYGCVRTESSKYR